MRRRGGDWWYAVGMGNLKKGGDGRGKGSWDIFLYVRLNRM